MDLKHSWNSSGRKSEPLLMWRNKKRRWNYTGPTISGNSEETFSKGWHSNVALPARTQAGTETERINWLLTIFFQCINPTVPETKGPHNWLNKEHHPMVIVQGKENKE